MARGQKYHCGTCNLPKFLRRILSYKFNDSCLLHDIEYSKITKYSQREADLRFRNNMLSQAGLNPFWILVAYFFYLAVKVFGHKAYKGFK